jgi:hypothetical protein
MKKSIPLTGRIVVAILSGLIQAPVIIAAEVPQFEIAQSQQARIERILALKTEAMKLPSMRSENGVLGKQVGALMDEIAEASTEAEMRSAQKVATENIRAKIVLWAADRKARLAEYEHFAKEYLNRPKNDAEAMEYFYREDPYALSDPFAGNVKPKWPPRDGTWAPHPVSKEDAAEKNRLMMEYSYFMPPKGRMFDHNNSRANISDAIRSLGNISNSYIIFETDINILHKIYKSGIENSPELPLKYQGKPMNVECIRSVVMIPDERSFKLLSITYSNPHLSQYVESHIGFYWKSIMAYLNNENEVKANHAAWIALAKQEWKEPEQQEFARLLLSIPPPKNS